MMRLSSNEALARVYRPIVHDLPRRKKTESTSESRELQDSQFILYRATVSAYSGNSCFGWLPLVEIGCDGGGSLVNVQVDITTELVLCQPHPLKGASFNLCSYPEISQTDLLEGLIFTSQIEFTCRGAEIPQLVGQTSILAEFDLQCSLDLRSIPLNAVTLEYFDRGSNSFVESFECIDGMYDDLDEFTNACFSYGCEGRCRLPASSAIQIKDIPITAIQDAEPQTQSPTPPQSTHETPTKSPEKFDETLWQAVKYEIVAFQSVSAGCKGLNPIFEFGCTNGGRVRLLLLAPTTNDLPTCSTLPQGDFIRCSFSIDEERVSQDDKGLSAEFECAGRPNSVAAKAFILPNTATCPNDPSIVNNLFNFLSIRYFDFETTDYKQAASCSGDSVDPTSRSDRTFCVSTGICEQGDCSIPGVSSEQITPIPENGWVTIPAESSLSAGTTNTNSPTVVPQTRSPPAGMSSQARPPGRVTPNSVTPLASSATYLSQYLFFGSFIVVDLVLGSFH